MNGPTGTGTGHGAQGRDRSGAGSAAAEVRSVSQVHKWWASKISPLLAASFLGLLVTDRPAVDAAIDLAVMVVSACVLASSAYVVNDWFDRHVDRAAGKTSRIMDAQPGAVAALVVGLDLVGVLPWLFRGLPTVGWVALGCIVVLPIVYSAPPVRLKERGVLGLIADASLAHVAPTVFALGVFGGFSWGDRIEAAVVVCAAIAWSVFSGLRRIVGHEVVDEPHDRAVGVRTWVVAVGAERARWTVRHVLLPGEVASMALVAAGLAVVAPVAAVVFGAIAVGLGFARVIGAWSEPLHAMPTATRERAVLYPFLVFWPALILALALAVRNPGFAPLVVVYLAAFWSLFVQEMRSLRVSGGETVHLVGWGIVNWWRHRFWPFVFRTVPNWFRYRLWPWVHHTVPNWFRYRLRPRVRRVGLRVATLVRLRGNPG